MGVCDKYPGQGQTRYSLLGQGHNNGIGDSKEQELIIVILCIAMLDTRVPMSSLAHREVKELA